MPFTTHQKILIGLFHAINMEEDEVATILATIIEEENITLNKWAMKMYCETNTLPTEQQIIYKLSEILPTTREIS